MCTTQQIPPSYFYRKNKSSEDTNVIRRVRPPGKFTIRVCDMLRCLKGNYNMSLFVCTNGVYVNIAQKTADTTNT